MTIEERMKEDGWSEFKDCLKQGDGEFYKGSFQKRFDDNFGKKYFINCSKYSFQNKISYSFDVQFNNKNGQAVNIQTVQWFFEKDEYDNHVSDLKEVCDFFENLWVVGEFAYYERWKND
jgi:intein-encoded DNA endonuclease-like protein